MKRRSLRPLPSVVCRRFSFLPESVEPHHFTAALGLVIAAARRLGCRGGSGRGLGLFTGGAFSRWRPRGRRFLRNLLAPRRRSFGGLAALARRRGFDRLELKAKLHRRI